MDNQEVGFVVSSKGYLAYLDGLPTIRINDLVSSEAGIVGLVHSLNPTQTEVLLLSSTSVAPGTQFKRTGKRLELSVGDYLIGRAINPLGLPIDGKGMLSKSAESKPRELEPPSHSIEAREFIKDQLITGISTVDTLIPLGLGQRELVIGDANSGIQNFLINIIVNQTAGRLASRSGRTGQGLICIYAAIGKPISQITNLINTLHVNKAMASSIVIASSSTDGSPLIYLTPLTALTIAEYFKDQGKNVLVILDDMGIHAKAYREISLLGGRSPGRQSYPGDIFYQQAKLLERAGKFNSNFGGGSITALPVVELNLNDFTGFIPTNLMSITDGHLLFRSNLYNKNQRPAIDIALSVSRVGRQTQALISNLISRRLRQCLAEAQGLETLAQFSAELPPQTQLILRQKQVLMELLKQDDLTLTNLPTQTMLLGLIFTSFINDKNEVTVRKLKVKILKFLTTDPESIKLQTSISKFKSDDELIKALESMVSRINAGIGTKQ